ncbi:hypothetical protein N7468_002887 [Penicillium chermesinum]|uniref:Uncharacterized protein n=1 Tax=Penicillium chermesinum TaxID=63820 RepID=A0A9W9PJI4_9EURO|nr:uncharacterized protein N7468_002887 [Penicillium chermesinum]KAJ5247904.1 hypothetical protein N7468_002887 [Penicillium chermesinum]KAJ6151661.1 hypothetical protein N7470_007258 [Penicillium chermesinum]
MTQCCQVQRAKDYLFITYLPSSKPSEDEKARARLQVRSHAAQKRYDRDNGNVNVQNKHLHGRSDSTISNTNTATASASEAESSSFVPHLPSPRIAFTDDDQHASAEVYSQDRSLSQLQSRTPKHLTNRIGDSPFAIAGIERFGSGSRDPFHSYPPRCPSAGSFEKCFTYSVYSLAPSDMTFSKLMLRPVYFMAFLDP